MKIRKATPSDAYDIAKVQVDTWKTTYKNIVPNNFLNQMTYESREKQWEQVMNVHPVFVAETETGEIIGFANGGAERTGDYPDYTGELYALYILEAYQKRGVGKLLLKSVVAELIQKNITSMIVLVLEANEACLFYEALGAQQIDTLNIKISDKQLNESVYGWRDIRKLLSLLDEEK